MKEITLFLLNNCPHCKLALRLQEELLAEILVELKKQNGEKTA